jgi:two-component system cell cycle sensor histidine kinase/response regulator CckA
MAAALRVLVVEDRDEDAELMLRELRRADVPCTARRVVTAAVFRRELAEFDPEIVLADYNVPGFGGMTALEILQAERPRVPLVIVTGSLDEETAAGCIKAGAADYVLKTNLVRLAPAVRGALALAHSRAEQRQAEERFRALVEHSWDAVALFSPDGTIVYGSPSTTRMLGYDLSEFVGRNAFEFIHPDDQTAVTERLGETMARPQARVGVAARVRHKDGSWRHLEGILTNLLDVPSVGAIVNNYRDVTERRSLQEQFIQAQKMEAVGRLAGGVAHDFNNILTAITGYTDLLLADLPGDDPRREDVDEIHRAAQRAAALTQQLLAFSRRQVMQPKVLGLNALVTDIEKLLRRLLGEDVSLATVLDPGTGNIRADPNQMQQVIMNLAVNARDAMPRGGRLTLETRSVQLDDAYATEHRGVTPGRYALLAVSDNGSGMTEETQSHLFEPFFTTKEMGKGTGLGLATVYGIVKQSGGHIWVYSEVGVGTTIKVHLPRVDEPTEPLWRPLPAPDHSVRGSETILLVEDEPAVRGVARQLLERQGYAVLEAADGPAALALCHEAKASVDLLLTDVVMPGISGRDLADRLALQYPKLRVLFMSGYTNDAIVRHGMLEPGLDYVQKPFPSGVLFQKIREVLDREP